MFKLKGPAMLQGSYSPAFPLKHQQKDMRLALALGDENAVSMPVSAAANEVRLHPLSTCTMPHRTQGLSENMWHCNFRSQAFKKARSLGLGDLDFSAVYEVVKDAGGSGQAWLAISGLIWMLDLQQCLSFIVRQLARHHSVCISRIWSPDLAEKINQHLMVCLHDRCYWKLGTSWLHHEWFFFWPASADWKHTRNGTIFSLLCQSLLSTFLFGLYFCRKHTTEML